MNRNKTTSQRSTQPLRPAQSWGIANFFERMARRFAGKMNRVTARFRPAHWLICWLVFLTMGVGSSMYMLLAQFFVTPEPVSGLTDIQRRYPPRSPPVSSDGLVRKECLDRLAKPVKGPVDTADGRPGKNQ
ncbi:MAG: hypothetical protein ACTHXT_14915 [Sphingobacterium sp.]